MFNLVPVSKMAELTIYIKHFIQYTKSAMRDRNDWLNSNRVWWLQGGPFLACLRSIKDGQGGWGECGGRKEYNMSWIDE